MKDPDNQAIPYYTEGMVIGGDGTIYLCGKVTLPGVNPREKDILAISDVLL